MKLQISELVTSLLAWPEYKISEISFWTKHAFTKRFFTSILMHTAITPFRLWRTAFVSVNASNNDSSVGAVEENSVISWFQVKFLNDSLLYTRSIDSVLLEHSLQSSICAIFPTFSMMYFLISWSFKHSLAITLLHLLATARPIFFR